MTSLAASSPSLQPLSAPDSAARTSPSRRASRPPHPRSAPGSSARTSPSLRASRPPHPRSAPGSAARTSPSCRASRPPHPRYAPDSAETTSPSRRADFVGSSPSPHGHSAPDSAVTTPPSRRADSVRVYALRDSCLEFLAELGRIDGAHHAVEMREQAPAEFSRESSDLVLAFLSKGTLCRMAYLSPDAPRPAKYESEDDDDDDLSSRTSTAMNESSYDGSSSDEDNDEEAKEDDDNDEDDPYDSLDDQDFIANPSIPSHTWTVTNESSYNGSSNDEDNDEEAKEDDDEDEDDPYDSVDDQDSIANPSIPSRTCTARDESSNNGSSNDEVDDEEAKEDGDVDWVYWEEDDAEKQETKSDPAYSLKLKVCPSSGYANIVLFDGKSWMSTTTCSLSWLSSTEAEIMVGKLADLSEIDMEVDNSLLVSNAMFLKRSEYEGVMVTSAAVEIFENCKLRPSLYDFNVHEILGKGAFCNVRLCTGRDQKDYAMKIIKCEEKDLNEPREVAIHSSLRSPRVVKFLQAWTESHIFVSYEECLRSGMSSQSDDYRESGEAPRKMQGTRYILILMELCQRTLADYISESSKLDAEKSLHIFKEIVEGVQYLHGQNVIHRDLKPSNIFMGKDNKFKLGDFGQSRLQPRYIVSFKATPNLGTIFYEAPELKKGERISDKVDIYSLGAIYFDLFNIFNTKLDKSLTFQDFKGDDGSKITWEGDFYLFKQMIAFDPVKRPSVNDVLEHISQGRSSLQKTEESYIASDLDQQSEDFNVTESRDSTPTEEAVTPRGAQTQQGVH